MSVINSKLIDNSIRTNSLCIIIVDTMVFALLSNL